MRVQTAPDPSPDRNLVAVHLKRFGEDPQQPPADSDGVLPLPEIRQQNGEAVCLGARQAVARPELGLQGCRHLLEDSVAQGVTNALVDHPESADVQDEHGRHSFTPAKLGQVLLDPVEEQRPIGQVGQSIVGCEMLQVLLGPHPLGNVLPR